MKIDVWVLATKNAPAKIAETYVYEPDFYLIFNSSADAQRHARLHQFHESWKPVKASLILKGSKRKSSPRRERGQ